MNATIYVGMRPGNQPKPSRRFRGGRVCSAPRCRTRLSIYNAGERCSVHQPREVGRTFGRLVGRKG